MEQDSLPEKVIEEVEEERANNTNGHQNDTPRDRLPMLNRDLLNTEFVFKTGAPLKTYLKTRSEDFDKCFTLKDLLVQLKNIILTGKLFDQTNPSMVRCDRELEVALNRKAVHVVNLRELVLDQISPTNTIPVVSPTVVSSMRVVTQTQTPPWARFGVSPGFKKVIDATIGKTRKTIFEYREITSILSRYIIARKSDLTDPRDVRVLFL